MPVPPSPSSYGAGPPSSSDRRGSPTPATWIQRVLATLWDWVYLWPGWVTLVVGLGFVSNGAAVESAARQTIGGVLLAVGLVLTLWRLVSNYVLDQGRTGYTYGKRKGGIRTVRIADGQPSGAGSCVVRYLLHGIINNACYLDYLWPLWDPRRQTLTDKILSTVVVQLPDPAA